MKCENCAHEQAIGKFCGKCGTKLQAVEKPQVEDVSVSFSEPETVAASESLAPPTLNQPVQPKREVKSMVKEFLNFDKMITPSIIKFVFWIGSGLTVLWGLILMIIGITSSYGGGFQVFLGLLTILIGPFVIRIYCELLILFFKIHETLQVIKEKSFTR